MNPGAVRAGIMVPDTSPLARAADVPSRQAAGAADDPMA